MPYYHSLKVWREYDDYIVIIGMHLYGVGLRDKLFSFILSITVMVARYRNNLIGLKNVFPKFINTVHVFDRESIVATIYHAYYKSFS